MSFFTPKLWKDFPTGGTDIDAPALIDLETRLSGYTDEQIAENVSLAGSGVAALQNSVADIQASLIPAIIGTMGSSLGSAQNLAMAVGQDTWLVGTLNTDLTVTLTAFPAPSYARIVGTQDATGGHGLSITDGITTLSQSIGTSANTPFEVLINSPNGVDIFAWTLS